MNDANMGILSTGNKRANRHADIQPGTAIGIGVLLETLLVRTVLVPAALIAIGDRVWWPGPCPADTESA